MLVAKYADHLPLYRQAQIYARQGVTLDRSTLADWVGRAAWWLTPLRDHLLADLKRSPRLFADETTAPVLEPGRGRTKTGQLWAYARYDRPWGGTDPPAVAYVYAPDRKGERPAEHLRGFTGVLQVDGYAGYRALGRSNQVQLAFCWAHVRRGFYEIAASRPAATEALVRIAQLYAIEHEIRVLAPDEPRAARQERSAPLVASLLGSWRPASPALAARASSPRRSATHSNAGTGSAGSSTTAGSRSTPTPSSAQSVRSPSTPRTRCSPAPTRAATAGP